MMKNCIFCLALVLACPLAIAWEDYFMLHGGYGGSLQGAPLLASARAETGHHGAAVAHATTNTPSPAQESATLTVVRLHCEYLENPHGVEDPSPNFGWVLASEERGQKQTAYQLLVYDRNDKLIWDSGKVMSPESSHVKYAGPPLQSSSVYEWTVRIWDKDGRQTPCTDRSRFVTALMDAREWNAQWIGRGPKQEPVVRWGTDFQQDDLRGLEALMAGGEVSMDHQSTLLRKDFSLDKPIALAILHVSGLGLFNLYVNGAPTGPTREHAPLKTLYAEQVLYSTFDLTSQLRHGHNTLGLMLGNGWYNTDEKYWGWKMQWWGFPKAIAQLQITYEDGSEETIVSDSSWKTSPGPVVSSCLYDGEVYDARLEQPGWNKTGFNDAEWQHAHVVTAPAGRLVSQLAPPIRITETINPVSVRRVKPGVFVFDMGQNFSGWTKIKAQGPAGTAVRLRHAENINDSGELDTTTLRNAKNTDTYILKGDNSMEIYEPYFTSHGFRYVEITGYPGTPTLADVQGRVAHSDCERAGAFSTDNDLINHIYDCAFWTQRSIMQGLPVDCPQRDERLGWGADAHVQAESSIFIFGAHQFYTKWLRDFQVQQCAQTGNLPHVTPRPGVSGYPCWSAAYPIIAWSCYQYYGDKRLLAAHYDNLRSYADYLTSRSSGHIQPRDTTGDWKSLVDMPRGGPQMISTIFYYYTARIVADSARVLGKQEDATKYGALAEDISAAFNNVFQHTERRRYLYGENSQAESALPLFFDLVPQKAKSDVVENLVSSISKQNDHLTTGFIGTLYMMEALVKVGRPDIAYRLLTNESYPSWGYMTKGRTTMSESWCARRGTNNHGGLGGGVIAWMFKHLAGINPDPEHPGFQKVLIKPYFPRELNSVNASAQTIKGRVESSWQRVDGRITLELSIPANSTARVYLPLDEPSHVTFGCTPDQESAHVTYRGKSKKSIVFDVASGRYTLMFNH